MWTCGRSPIEEKKTQNAESEGKLKSLGFGALKKGSFALTISTQGNGQYKCESVNSRQPIPPQKKAKKKTYRKQQQKKGFWAAASLVANQLCSGMLCLGAIQWLIITSEGPPNNDAE